MTDLKRLTEMAARLRDVSESVGGWAIMEYVATALESVVQVREDALALAENICRDHAREYGAINESVTIEHRRLDYAAERALLSAADAIRALKHTGEDGETKP